VSFDLLAAQALLGHASAVLGGSRPPSVADCTADSVADGIAD
jgi:hypothetical protein